MSSIVLQPEDLRYQAASLGVVVLMDAFLLTSICTVNDISHNSALDVRLSWLCFAFFCLLLFRVIGATEPEQ